MSCKTICIILSFIEYIADMLHTSTGYKDAQTARNGGCVGKEQAKDFGYILLRRAFVEAIEGEHNGVARITK